MKLTKHLDERINSLQEEIKRMTESFARLRDDLLPVFRVLKETKPLPTPESASPMQSASVANSYAPQISGLARKFSTKKLFLNKSSSDHKEKDRWSPTFDEQRDRNSPRSPGRNSRNAHEEKVAFFPTSAAASTSFSNNKRSNNQPLTSPDPLKTPNAQSCRKVPYYVNHLNHSRHLNHNMDIHLILYYAHF